ncbi:S-adenosyl-L-methionine-dependent methyltransferase [Sesbania bispinosa]|nr:S-adenosyl-L-methionine-dependent methyltransferase [Sesbania bispinosa]
MGKRRPTEEPQGQEEQHDTVSLLPSQRKKAKQSSTTNSDASFFGKPVPATEARAKWPHRYSSKVEKKGSGGSSNVGTSENEILQAKSHYHQAKVDGVLYKLFDDAYVKAEDGKPDYIARIVEMFETVDNELYFTAQWFYRARDTVIKDHGDLVDKKRVFISDVKDDNPLDCIVSKVKIAQITPNVGLNTKKRKIPSCDFYYDMKYTVPYLTFSNLANGSERSDADPYMDEDQGDDEVDNKKNEASENASDSEEFEVEKLLAVCYGDPNNVKKPGTGIEALLSFYKSGIGVRWKGYDSSEDTWEPVDGLSDCQDVLEDFVKRGYKKKLLPLPGDADFICGGPPCQGVSGFNRFRNQQAPLEDVKNKQLLVYMDIIDFLKPKYVLMENVVDILKFAGGFLGRYAIGRLVSMNYQARMGMMAAGSYGLPQFRMRVFLWGALPTEKLPPYPLPTHEVVARGFIPTEFEEITVAYETKETCQLADALFLGDAISDLPAVTNDEGQDERNYGTTPRTEFQRYIRLKRSEMVGYMASSQSAPRRILYDHRPLQLNKDDYERVCQIPKKKGANFRDLPGVLVKDNKVEWDPSVERVLLKSGKPLVPDYAMSFVRGTSPKPFGRLWWDEIVSTVVTRAEPHNQIVLHPTQDRVLTIRENARLQGFPDCYKLCGPIKERYIQVGNAVAVPVALALGYTFGLACQGLCDNKPLTTLPFKYPSCLSRSSSTETDNDDSS